MRHVPAALLVFTLAPAGCSRTPAGEAKESDFRAMKPGATFVRADNLDLDWAPSAAWTILTTSFAESTSPMSGAEAKCRAYGVMLREGHQPAPWAAVAVFCDDRGLVRSTPEYSKRATRTILTWPVRADAGGKLALDLRFVDALDAGHQVLWINEQSWTRGFLSAMEYAYARNGNVLKPILRTVGADPAAYSRYGASEEVDAKRAESVSRTYDAGFIDEGFPRRFRTSYADGERPVEMTYELVDGRYEWRLAQPKP